MVCLVEPSTSLVLMRLPALSQEVQAFYLGARSFSWLRWICRYQVNVKPLRNALNAESVFQIGAGE